MKRSIALFAAALTVPLSVAAPAEAASVPKGAKKAVVVKIVNGDTIDVRFTRTGPTVRVRLLEVDTPERGRAGPRRRPSAPPRSCPDSTSTPEPTPTPDPPSTGNDPRFPTCRAANDAGYGPYRRGADPEYGWYQDRDGDGVVCER